MPARPELQPLHSTYPQERLLGPQVEGPSASLGTGSEASREGPVPGLPFDTRRETAATQGGRTAREAGAGATLVIAVSDTGKGIPAEELATIFDEYRQVKGQSESIVQRGTGLGLSITKKFAKLLGGGVSVESQVGKGTTFTVSLPAKYEA